MASLSDLPFNPTDGSIGATAAQQGLYGDNQTALGWRMLEHVPGAGQVAGWNAWRASNTIMNASGGKSRGRIRNHLPGNITKMSSYDVIAGTGKYTPFDLLARSGNWAGRAKAKGNWRPGAAGADDTPLFQSGSYARLSTASRLSAGADATAIRGASDFVKTANSELYDKMKDRFGDAITGDDLGDYVAGSGRGIYSNAVNGYVRGATRGPGVHAHWDDMGKGFKDGVKFGTKGRVFGGAAKGAEHIGLGMGNKAFSRAGFKAAGGLATKSGAKFALGSAAKVGGAFIPGVNVALAAWTAVDLTKMGLEATKALPGFARDSLNSFKGGIQKPVFGSRYVDNSVAATSRQRGVMAIQNSQLNMRSSLGNEAAGLHAYYG